jgi:hypothetical protein
MVAALRWAASRAGPGALLPRLPAAAVKCPGQGCVDKAGLDHRHLSRRKTANHAGRLERTDQLSDPDPDVVFLPNLANASEIGWV